MSNAKKLLCIKYGRKEDATDHIRAMNRRAGGKNKRKGDSIVIIRPWHVEVRTENNGKLFRVICKNRSEASRLYSYIYLPGATFDLVSHEVVFQHKQERAGFVARNETAHVGFSDVVNHCNLM